MLSIRCYIIKKLWTLYEETDWCCFSWTTSRQCQTHNFSLVVVRLSYYSQSVDARCDSRRGIRTSHNWSIQYPANGSGSWILTSEHSFLPNSNHLRRWSFRESYYYNNNNSNITSKSNCYTVVTRDLSLKQPNPKCLKRSGFFMMSMINIVMTLLCLTGPTMNTPN